MSKKFNMIRNIILIILFPLGIIYCIGKCLFANSLCGFIGALLLCMCGFCVGIYLYDIGVLDNCISYIKTNILTFWR